MNPNEGQEVPLSVPAAKQLRAGAAHISATPLGKPPEPRMDHPMLSSANTAPSSSSRPGQTPSGTPQTLLKLQMLENDNRQVSQGLHTCRG